MSDSSGAWMPLETRTRRRRVSLVVATSTPLIVAVPVVIGLNPIRFRDELDSWTRILLSLGSSLLVIGIVVGVIALRAHTPKVDLERGVLRVGSRVIPFDQIDRAMVLRLNSSRRRRSFAISFGPDGGPMAIVSLRSKAGRMLDREQTDRLATVLERTSIEMPKDSNDPQGRFARYNFPKNIDRAAAIALVRDPPGPGEALPIPGLGTAQGK